MDQLTRDYFHAKEVARRWARIALRNRRDGIAWKQAAKNAHDALAYALLIIR